MARYEVIDVDDYPSDHEWGNDAMLTWEGGGGSASRLSMLSDISTDGDGEPDDDWGNDACLEWDGGHGSATHLSILSDTSSDGDDGPDDNDACLVWEGSVGTPRDEAMAHVESGDEKDASASGNEDEHDFEDMSSEGEDREETDAVTPVKNPHTMPDYASWDVPKLQRLVKKYGYRPSSDHAALVQVATSCWSALHPVPTVSPRKRKGKGRASGRASKASSKTAPKAKPKTKSKTSATADQGTASESDVANTTTLDEQFYAMITDDESFYLRVLRYEPIAFDELVSRAIAAGVTGRSWKPRLKRFLDLRGVTYYTSDPTAQRRRYR